MESVGVYGPFGERHAVSRRLRVGGGVLGVRLCAEAPAHRDGLAVLIREPADRGGARYGAPGGAVFEPDARCVGIGLCRDRRCAIGSGATGLTLSSLPGVESRRNTHRNAVEVGIHLALAASRGG